MTHVARLFGPFHQSIPNVALAVALLAGALASASSAADPFYFGAWKIESAKLAPWADASRTDPAEIKALTGKTIVFRATEIVGPHALACHGPKYRVKFYPADWLFQGSFGEMHAKDASADPANLAASLGFHGTSWKTLETGCGNELDYHFIDTRTAAIGLNNAIYFLKKR